MNLFLCTPNGGCDGPYPESQAERIISRARKESEKGPIEIWQGWRGPHKLVARLAPESRFGALFTFPGITYHVDGPTSYEVHYHEDCIGRVGKNHLDTGGWFFRNDERGWFGQVSTMKQAVQALIDLMLIKRPDLGYLSEKHGDQAKAMIDLAFSLATKAYKEVMTGKCPHGHIDTAIESLHHAYAHMSSMDSQPRELASKYRMVHGYLDDLHQRFSANCLRR